jgi:hypothetical protein
LRQVPLESLWQRLAGLAVIAVLVVLLFHHRAPFSGPYTMHDGQDGKTTRIDGIDRIVTLKHTADLRV